MPGLIKEYLAPGSEGEHPGCPTVHEIRDCAIKNDLALIPDDLKMTTWTVSQGNFCYVRMSDLGSLVSSLGFPVSQEKVEEIMALKGFIEDTVQ